ncbi:hypothetical protein NADFUDRAFT_53528 [Nadsonia fulvescens var. elongata DSM 6958]|uniref:C3H1-type domain-containing protein n=1 Tax=Nadsonia fulvescens var. elongata DSM 6958 TaxID=857566 RepID=A0A1E3PCX0_9ASCO|nr:hypothetical protein NADFUDRAFT_53528 [Nadsonia fulvescens var. elongata DSM 6958]
MKDSYNPYTYTRPAHRHFPTAPSSTSSLVSNISLSTAASSSHWDTLLPDVWGDLSDETEEASRLCPKSRLWSSRRDCSPEFSLDFVDDASPDQDLPEFNQHILNSVNDLMAHLDLEIPMGPQDSTTAQDFWSLSTLSPDPQSSTLPSTSPVADIDPTPKKKKKRSKNRKKSPKTNADLYKTEPCVAYAQSLKTKRVGKCPYGDKCQFAHGPEELRSVAETLRPQNYRSKRCVNWAKYGVCVYNDRCCFRHE